MVTRLLLGTAVGLLFIFVYQSTLEWQVVDNRIKTTNFRSVNCSNYSNASNEIICVDQSVVIGSSPLIGFAYQWTPNIALNNNNISQPYASPNQTTSYYLIATDSFSNCTIYDTITVFVRNPVIDAGADLNFCGASVVNLGTPAVPNQIYSWTPTIGLSPNSNVAQPNIGTTTDMTFVLNVVDTLTGCSAKDTIKLTKQSSIRADAGADAITLCYGDSVLIGTSDSAAYGYNYYWTPSMGLNNNTLGMPYAKPIKDVIYLLVVSQPSNPNCYSTDIITVNIAPTPPPPLEDTLICLNKSLMIGLTPENNLTYEWTPSTGLSDSNIANPIATPNTTTTYQVTASDSMGCNYIDSIEVSVFTPRIYAGLEQTICFNAGYASIGDTLVDSTYTYQWAPNTDLTTPNEAQTLASPSITTNYTLAATDPITGCSNDAFVTIEVLPAPIVDAGLSQTICLGDSILIGTPDSSAYLYEWTPSINLSTPDSNYTMAMPPQIQTYVLNVIDTNINNCIAKDSIIITIADTPAVPILADIDICPDKVAELGFSTTNPNYTYNWTPSIYLNNPNNNIPIATPPQDITYHLVVTDISNTCISQVTQNVQIIPEPIVNLGPDVTFCSNSSPINIGIEAINGYTYSWAPTAGLNANNLATVMAEPIITTTYILTVQNPLGCETVDSITVYVSNLTGQTLALKDTSMCKGSVIQIGPNPINNVTYNWSPSIGLNDISTARPSVSNDITTYYTLTIIDTITGCQSRDGMTLKVLQPIVDAGNDQYLCNNDSLTIGSPPTQNMSLFYSWMPSTGLDNPFSPQPKVNGINAPVTYILNVRNNVGCTNRDTVVITPYTQGADAGQDSYYCLDSAGNVLFQPQLNGRYYGNSILHWSPSTWVTDSTDNNPFIVTDSIQTRGSVLLTYTVTNLITGCTDNDKVLVETDPLINFLGDLGTDLTICEGDTVRIGSVPVVNVDYKWTNAPDVYGWGWGVPIPTTLEDPYSANPFAYPLETETYYITANTYNGCSKTDTMTIFVSTPTAKPGIDTSICKGDSLVLGSPTSSFTTYRWVPEGGLNNPYIAQPVAKPPITTVYTLLTYNAICEIPDTAIITVHIGTAPYVNAGTDTIICEPEKFIGVIIGEQSTEVGYTYEWSPDIGLSDAYTAQPYAQPDTSTLYTLRTTYNLTGCNASDNIYVDLSGCATPIFQYMPIDTTIICGQIANEIAIAADPCGATLNTSLIQDTIPSNCANEYQILKTWTATNDCNNSFSYTQTITVIDTIPPYYAEQAGVLDRIVPCDDNLAYTLARSLSPTPLDGCANAPTLVNRTTSVTGPACFNNALRLYETRTWRYQDECGNQSSYQQTIVIEDAESPSFTTPLGALDRNVGNDLIALDSALILTPEITDNCTPVDYFQESVTDVLIYSDSCNLNQKTLVRTFTFSDPCQGVSIDYIQNVTFVTDDPTCGIDAYEPNNNINNAAILYSNLGTNTFRRSRICPQGDKDYFTFETTTLKRNVHLHLYDLPKDYNLYLYDTNYSLLDSSTNNCADEEDIYYNNLPVGNYYALVVGHGVWSASEPYSLGINLSAQNFQTGNNIKDPTTLYPWDSIIPWPNPHPDTIKPNIFTTYTRSKTVTNDNLHLYPNPVREHLFINLLTTYKPTNIKLSIINIQGQIVYQKNSITLPQMVNVNKLSSGIYFVLLEVNEQVLRKKIIVCKK